MSLRKENALRKKELTAQIKRLTQERAALCIADKAQRQSAEPTYLILVASKMIVIRVEPGCDPTTLALNAGITKIMHYYGLLKRDCYGVEPHTEPSGPLAFQGAAHPTLQTRWMCKWELWTWGSGAPEFFASASDKKVDVPEELI